MPWLGFRDEESAEAGGQIHFFQPEALILRGNTALSWLYLQYLVQFNPTR